jgi:hypothetical protein
MDSRASGATPHGVNQRSNATQHNQIRFLEDRFMIYGARITIFCIAVLLSLSVMASAGELTIPNSFSNDTRADAEEVNANFNAVKEAVDDNNDKIVVLSAPKSITYSAMGFTAKKSQANNMDHATEFEKHDGGYLITLDNESSFYHNVTLSSGVTITQIRAFVYDGDNSQNDTGHIRIALKKIQIVNDQPEIVEIGLARQSDNIGYQVMRTELEEAIEAGTGYPSSYFIEVYFDSISQNQRFYSVTIDYEYTEPQ